MSTGAVYSLTCDACGKTEESTGRLGPGWLKVENHPLAKREPFVFADVCSFQCLAAYARKNGAR